MDSNLSSVVHFILNGDRLSVSAAGDDPALGFGRNVTIDGEYIMAPPYYTNGNIVNQILPTNTLKDRMKQLLGDTAYTQMISVMEDGFPYDSDILTYSGSIDGAGEGVDLKITDDKIYCLGYWLDSEGYTFYTNDGRYADKLPDYLKIAADQPVHFIYKDI